MKRTIRQQKCPLSLLVGPDSAAKLVKALRKQEGLAHFAVKDVLRASALPYLGDDPEVAADLEKVKLGKKLSPVCSSKARRCGWRTVTTASVRVTT